MDLDQPRINYSGIRTLDTELYEPSANQHQVLDKFKYLFASSKTDENIYPVTISEISDSQSRHRTYKKYFKKKSFKNRDYKITPKVVTTTTVLVFDKKRLVIPTEEMQSRIIQWYHHYLQHPGENRLEETLVAAMYWPRMRSQIRKHVKTCDRCQLAK